MLGVDAPFDLARLDRSLSRATLAISGVIAAVYVAIGIVGHDKSYLARSTGVIVVAVLAGWQIVTGRERMWQLLAAAAAVIVVQARILGAPGGAASAIPDLGIVIVGMAAGIFIMRHLFLFLALYTGFIAGAHLVWRWEDFGAAVAHAVIGAAVFIFGSGILWWMRTELWRSTDRYRWLFDTTPVAIRVEDFSGVGEWLDRLRTEGVDDLESWLEADPRRVLKGVRLIRVTDINRAGVHMLEAAGRDAALGAIPDAGVTDESRASFVRQFVGIWNDEDQFVVEVIGGRTFTNKHLDLLLYWNAPRVRGRLDLTRVTIAMVDVTHLRQTERNLIDLLRSKDEFVATISHELRTPLTTVVGLSEELRDSAGRLDPAELEDLLELLASESHEVSAIVEDLLTAARADSGNVTVTVENVDLRAEVASVLRAFGERPVLADTEAPAVARADAARVRQVLRNLLVNAQRYGGPIVGVQIRAFGDAVWVEVCDNGPPLPKHQRHAIFERFYRAGQQPGLTASVGLGLAVSRELARLMEGDLTYRHDGTNSIFTLQLRAAAPAQTRPVRVQRAAG
jgi:signal transduction histidine kinase